MPSDTRTNLSFVIEDGQHLRDTRFNAIGEIAQIGRCQDPGLD